MKREQRFLEASGHAHFLTFLGNNRVRCVITGIDEKKAGHGKAALLEIVSMMVGLIRAICPNRVV